MSSCRFSDYIDFLRDNIGNVIQYREGTGTMEASLHSIKDDLFHQDPFVVIGASLRATKIFEEKSLYH